MILEKEQYAKKVLDYYLKHYGENEADVWYEQPAVNVWVFGRDNKIITLKSDVRTGEVAQFIEEII